MEKKRKGEEIPGVVGQRPDDAHPGVPLGGFAERDDTADADTQEGSAPPQPIEPADPGQSHDPSAPPPPRR